MPSRSGQKQYVLPFVAVALIASAAPAQFSLTTTYAAGNGQTGAMFDIVALSAVQITSIDASVGAGTTNTFQIYTKTGSWVGNDTNSAAWTLLGTAAGVVSAGTNVPTPIPLPLSVLIPTGATQAFYVTTTAGTVQYTNGATGTGPTTVFVQDTFMQILMGCGKTYPFGSIFQPRMFNGTVHYTPGTGLFANFTATGASGHAPRTVTFADASYSSAPGGVQAWAWDFDNDGIVDSTAQNPSYTYLTPGDYTVVLTVQDASFPPNTITKTNFVHVTQYVFDAITTGGGVGDLTLVGVPAIGAPSAVEGYTLISFTAPGAVGTGAFFGISPDAITFSIFNQAAAIGNPLHYLIYPGIYPDAPLVIPAGSLAFLVGTTADFVQVGLTSSFGLAFWSNVDRVTF